MKRYCTSCGSPTEYSVKKPIFCSNCGNSFDKIQINKVERFIAEELNEKLDVVIQSVCE